MPKPATRIKNANQRPGQIVNDGKQKRRTTEQKQLDDAQVEQTRQEEAAARERGLQCLANIIERATGDEEKLLKDPPRPRPRPRIVLKVSANPTANTLPTEDRDQVSSNQITGVDGVTDLQGNNSENEASDDGGSQEDGAPAQPTARKSRIQKVSTRTAVEAARGSHQDGGDNKEPQSQLEPEKGRHTGTSCVLFPSASLMSLLTETVLFYWDLFDFACRVESSEASESAKKDFSGVGVRDWANKVATSKSLSLQTLPSARSTYSSSHRASSISSSGPLIKAPQVSPLPTSPLAETASLARAPSEVQDSNPYLDGDDSVERGAMEDPFHMALGRRTAVMDVADVVSGSEGDEWVPPPPSFISKKGHARRVNSYPLNGHTADKKPNRKRLQPSEGDNDELEATSVLVSKCSKVTSQGRAGASQRSGSSVNNRYIKDDLPPGSTVDNAWRRLFISALAHFVGGYDNPWTIPSDKFISVLQQIWDCVYTGRIEHTVTATGAVYHMAKQGLNNWRSGFALIAVAVVTTFFANDPEFEDPNIHVEFAKAMIEKRRFLFKQSNGSDRKMWTGLWRGPLVLQTFAHHFNFIQGRAAVSILEKELCGPRGALAMASAAVLRILTLVAEGQVSFVPATPGLGNTWTAVLPKGSQYEFDESVWGVSTRHFLGPIKDMSDENFDLVVEEAMKYVKKPPTSSITSTADSTMAVDSDYEDLFEFR